MTFYTSEKIAYNNALNFKLNFANTAPGKANSVGYVFIGNSLSDESLPANTEPVGDTAYYERLVWDNMFAAKQVTEDAVELVIPRYTYSNVASPIYRQYDDRIDLSDLLTANASQNLKPIYVINSEGNVYKCLSNNNGSVSTQEPTGDYSVNESGNIFVLDDGYIWKYMYNINLYQRFQNANWIPVPTSTSKLDYNSSNTVSINGEITTVQVTNPGTGYVDSQIKVDDFASSCTTLIIKSDYFNANNLSTGMGISGTGIVGDVFITSVNNFSRAITLSTASLSSGGGLGNTYNIFTRIVVTGDGVGFDDSDSVQCRPVLINNTVQKIEVTEDGINYNYANVLIYGTGSGATARAIIAPKYGHAYNAARELGARAVMISVSIGNNDDATDGNVISQFTSYRQYGLLLNPHKYGESQSILYSNAIPVVSQTFDLVVDPGPQYDLNEFVYQGISQTNAFFTGYVHAYENSIDNTIIKLTKIRGNVSNSALLKSASVPTGRQLSSANGQYWSTGEFEPYTGDIVYVENVERIERDEGQTENIKLIVKF